MPLGIICCKVLESEVKTVIRDVREFHLRPEKTPGSLAVLKDTLRQALLSEVFRTYEECCKPSEIPNTVLTQHHEERHHTVRGKRFH